MRRIDTIAIHCSATPNGRTVTAADIDGWHKARGFLRTAIPFDAASPDLLHIGYHFVIGVTGTVTIGRDLSEAGAHVAGFNSHSIGICIAGTDRFTPPQWAALRGITRSLQDRFPGVAIKGHRDFSPDQNHNGHIEPFEWLKICPGFDVAGWLNRDMLPTPDQVLP